MATSSSMSAIIGGDFNTVLCPRLEKRGGNVDDMQSTQISAKIKAFLSTFSLEDIIRNHKPDEMIVTWHNFSMKISSRLDYWFISENLLNSVIKSNIKNALYTDHDRVTFTLKLTNEFNKRGNGYWKFNVSFLKNNEYVILIEDLIRNSAKEVQNYSDKGFVWDYIKMQVRSATIKFARQYYIDQKSEEIELSKRLEHLQKQYILNDEPCEEIQIIRKQLENIQTRRANGAKIRAKIMEIEDGEKNTAYFLSLEKTRAEKSTITTRRSSDRCK